MPLLASHHVAFETVGQIGITNFVEDGDDLLLNSVRQFHFELGGHALYMWRRLMSVDFEEMLLTEVTMAVLRGSGAVLLEFLSRIVFAMWHRH